MAKSPQGFIVVMPGEIIEIAQDDDKSRLARFHALPKELMEKFPATLEIPRCPYEVLRTHKYAHIVKDDMMKVLEKAEGDRALLQRKRPHPVLADCPPCYSMTYKTEKRHDRNHAVSRKQL